MRKLYSLLILSFFAAGLYSQTPYPAEELQEPVSLHPYVLYASAGQENLDLKKVIEGIAALEFKPMKIANPNIGFTADQYWAKFRIRNTTQKDLHYYLETARPITDEVDFFTISDTRTIEHQQSGDLLPFGYRSYEHRKTIFELHLPPGETLEVYIRYGSDGEVLNMPIILHSDQTLLRSTYLEQLVFGLFFGILLITAIIYLFFFFALKERSLLYYSLYVLSVGLLQFSLDGYFYQYLGPGAGWISTHAVLLFAILSAGLLAKYAEVYLEIRLRIRFLPKLFTAIYLALGLLFLSVLFFPVALAMAYPLVNVLGLAVLLLILVSLSILIYKKIPVDKFFCTGLFFLILGFVIFILNNLSILPTTFLSQNSAKLGTGLEIIFLSLSMANRIRKIKSDNEEMQALALKRSEEMNALKSQFMSNLSHELRTPLNAIMGLADSICSEARDEKLKLNSRLIKASSSRLLHQINDILDFSKIEKGELKLERELFDPLEVLKDLRLSFERQAREKGIGFEFQSSIGVPGLVMGDGNRLAQMVNILLDNAVKFTQEGRVSMKLETLEGKDNRLCVLLTVTDTGIGIPGEKKEIIFDSLTQENIGNNRKYGGLGLGLYILKVLVDLHRGEIDLKSTANIGTSCSLRLFYEKGEPEFAPRSQPEDSYDLQGSHILVVEDDPINRMVIKMLLQKWKGTEISFAVNGVEALEKLLEDDFNLVLMDLQMPILDGYEACIAIRKGEAGLKNQGIPIIAVTADVMESTKQRVRNIGMNAYVPKPVNRDELYKKVIALLKAESLSKT